MKEKKMKKKLINRLFSLSQITSMTEKYWFQNKFV